jgi:hypothetical protein
MSDALQDSIREVSTIAHGLQELQQRMQAYAQASQKLTDVSSHLSKLCEHIHEIQLAFTQVATQADICNQVTAFNTHLDVVKHTLTAQQQTLDSAFNDLQQERQQQALHLATLLKKAENSEQGLEQLKQGIQQIHTHNNQQMQLLNLINQVSTQNIAAPIVQQTQVLLEIKNLSYQHYQHDQAQNIITQKQFEDISRQLIDLQRQFQHTQQQVDTQEQHLDILSKRRGFIF